MGPKMLKLMNAAMDWSRYVKAVRRLQALDPRADLMLRDQWNKLTDGEKSRAQAEVEVQIDTLAAAAAASPAMSIAKKVARLPRAEPDFDATRRPEPGNSPQSIAAKYRKYLKLMERLGPEWLIHIRPKDTWAAMTPQQREQEILDVQHAIQTYDATHQDALLQKVIARQKAGAAGAHPAPVPTDVPMTTAEAW